jgi:5S rRNA maturation endonuclease (ribonuclease M5)/KaiC/GvpD/RAD55 family RecA-like ATPase
MSKLVSSHRPCPLCSSSDAYSVYDDGHGYCFSCNEYYPKRKKDQFDLNDFTYEYLPWRGVRSDIFKFYDCKTQVNAEGKPVAVGFKYPNGSVKLRRLDSKDIFWDKEHYPAPEPGLFGRNKFAAGSHKYVIITEGELDALSLHQVTRVPAVSVQSSSSAVRDCTADMEWLASFERIFLAFDNDKPGQDATRAVARLFEGSRLYHVRFSHHKDANDFLRMGEDTELLNVWTNSKRYLPETVISDWETFKQLVQEPPKRGVPYPWQCLTDMTYGIRTGESVLLTAREKVGKTEIMHFIEHQLLKETDSNVASIFLEEPKQRHLQALAGIELGRPVHLPDSGVSSAETCSALERITAAGSRLYLYNHFGSCDTGVLLDTIRYLVSACGCRYVLLDHISMAVVALGEDERRALDYLSNRLEMLVKELDFCLIYVSHVNDDGLTRGSRWLTKVTDIVISAERDLMAADPVERNTIHLKIPYSRYPGLTGPAGSIIFDPSTYSFRERNYAEASSDYLRTASMVG